jgi:hypothetical protein
MEDIKVSVIGDCPEAYDLTIAIKPGTYHQFLGFELATFDPLKVLRRAIVAGSSFVMEFKENELESISLNVERLLVVKKEV